MRFFIFLPAFCFLFMPGKKLHAQITELEIQNIKESILIKDAVSANVLLLNIEGQPDYPNVKTLVKVLRQDVKKLDIELGKLPDTVASEESQNFLEDVSRETKELRAMIFSDTSQSMGDADAVLAKLQTLQARIKEQKTEWWARQQEWADYWEVVRVINSRWLDGLNKWYYDIPDDRYSGKCDIKHELLFQKSKKNAKGRICYFEMADLVEKALMKGGFGSENDKTTRFWSHMHGDGFIAVTEEKIIYPDAGGGILFDRSKLSDYHIEYKGEHRVRLIVAVTPNINTMLKKGNPVPHDLIHGYNLLDANYVGAQPKADYLGFYAACRIYVLIDYHPYDNPDDVKGPKSSVPEPHKTAESYLLTLGVLKHFYEKFP